MIQQLITPILFDYHFLDNLCQRASLNSQLDANKYHQFKLAIFISFNRYLVDSLLLMPEDRAQEILTLLSGAMLENNEELTLSILNLEFGFFDELVDDFLKIIKKLK